MTPQGHDPPHVVDTSSTPEPPRKMGPRRRPGVGTKSCTALDNDEIYNNKKRDRQQELSPPAHVVEDHSMPNK